MSMYNSILDAVHAKMNEMISSGIVSEEDKTLDVAGSLANVVTKLENQLTGDRKTAVVAANEDASKASIADQLGAILEIANTFVVEANPLTALDVDADIGVSEDLLGKVVGDLQEDVTIENGVISGKLTYVRDYTGFSGTLEEQSGHYLAIHAAATGVTGATIKAFITKESTLDSDGITVIRIAQHNIDKGVTFTITKEGYGPISKHYSFAGLELLPDVVGE